MGSIKRNYSGWAVLPVVAGILLLAAAVMAEGRSTSCTAECPNRKGLTACIYRCWFGRIFFFIFRVEQFSTQEVVLLTASEAECAAYCKMHAWSCANMGQTPRTTRSSTSTAGKRRRRSRKRTSKLSLGPVDAASAEIRHNSWST